jgi:hypothetical protein
MLAAADVQVQDSDLLTGAAEYTEADISANGGLQFGPTWAEGIIQRQGIILDYSTPGFGNTVIPVNDTPQAYLDAMLRLARLFKEEHEKFTVYQANSIRLSRILEASITGAEYARLFSQAIGRKENPVKTLEETLRDENELERYFTSEWLRKELVKALKANPLATPLLSSNSKEVAAFLVPLNGEEQVVLIDLTSRFAGSNETNANILDNQGSLRRHFRQVGAGQDQGIVVVDAVNDYHYGVRSVSDILTKGLGVVIRAPGIQVLKFEKSGARLAEVTGEFTNRVAASFVWRRIQNGRSAEEARAVGARVRAHISDLQRLNNAELRQRAADAVKESSEYYPYMLSRGRNFLQNGILKSLYNKEVVAERIGSDRKVQLSDRQRNVVVDILAEAFAYKEIGFKVREGGARLADGGVGGSGITPLVIGVIVNKDTTVGARLAVSDLRESLGEQGISARIREFTDPLKAAQTPGISIIIEASLVENHRLKTEVFEAIARLDKNSRDAVTSLLQYLVFKKLALAEIQEKGSLEDFKAAEALYIGELREILKDITLPATSALDVQLTSSGAPILTDGFRVIDAREFAGTLAGGNFERSLIQLKEFSDEATDSDLSQFVEALSAESGIWKSVYGIDTEMVEKMSVKEGKERRGVLVSWNAFQKNPQTIEKEYRELKGSFVNVSVLAEGTDRAAFIAEHPEAAIFGNNIVMVPAGTRNLSSVQAAYHAFVADAMGDQISKQFTLVSEEGEFTADDGIDTQDEKNAILMELSREDQEKGMIFGSIKAAAILVFSDLFDEAELPSFLRKLGKNAFMYVPKIAPIQWAVWMSAVRTTLTTVGSAA